MSTRRRNNSAVFGSSNRRNPSVTIADRARGSVKRRAPWAKAAWIIASALLAGSCAGPVPMNTAIDHQYEADYVKHLNAANHDGRAAFLDWRAEQTGESVDKLEHEDAELSTTHNPFNARTDVAAVRRGAVLFKYHCARCHGDDARGHGPAVLPDHSANDFHTFGQRFAATIHGGAPRRWFKVITNGTGDQVKYPDEPPGPAMPAFGDKLTREQIWLLITYLQSLDVHFPKSTDAAVG